MNPPQFGTGSQLLGGSNPLVEAMKSRGVDTSILQQQTPSSAGFDPNAQSPASLSPQAPQGMPTGAPQGAQPPMPLQGAPLPQGSESELIIKALSERLRSDSKIKEFQVKGV